ncbi:hypothetical protein ACIPSJ_27075 [Streptomyces sp. NPDC090088]|uniref:hypothetical protein n=1 Tax=Streptomyces sp. NPDC090088 TaxID=3365944 RepID=UPI0038242501
MPFGSADRAQLQQIADQLGRISVDLAALKQQATDQQHTIDQIRQDASAAINTGLAEVRAVAREAMTRTTDLVTGPLSHLSTEIVGVRGVLNQIDGYLRAASARPGPEPEPTSAPQDQQQPAPSLEPQNLPTTGPEPAPQSAPAHDSNPVHSEPAILRAAAGIAHATIEAHRDTWAFLIQVAGREEHFHIPGKVDDNDGFVSVRFSGPSLVAAITSLTHVTHTADNPVTRAIADHIATKITTAVQAVTDNPRTSGNGNGKPVRIVIDDRAQADEAGNGVGPDTAADGTV